MQGEPLAYQATRDFAFGKNYDVSAHLARYEQEFGKIAI